jgi:FkbM family methyltransferase
MYNSQENQDEYLENNIFKGYKNGFFVDVGAHNGISINNTLYFEKYNNWTGINIEPIPKVYDQLKLNRPACININCAVSNTEGVAEFILNEGYSEMISGLKDNYDIRHHERLKKEIQQFGSESKIVDVITRKLESIFEEHNIKHVNYLTIDVEGSEFKVIKSINFDKVFIDVIEFENNYENISEPIVKYLEDRDYIIINKNIDIFMIHKNSKFYKKEN